MASCKNDFLCTLMCCFYKKWQLLIHQWKSKKNHGLARSNEAKEMSLELWADWKVELPSLRTSLMGTSLLRWTLIMVQFLVSQSFLFNPSYLGVQSLVELLLIGIWWLNQDQRSGWGLKRWDCAMSADKINNRKGDWSKSTGINFSL